MIRPDRDGVALDRIHAALEKYRSHRGYSSHLLLRHDVNLYAPDGLPRPQLRMVEFLLPDPQSGLGLPGGDSLRISCSGGWIQIRVGPPGDVVLHKADYLRGELAEAIGYAKGYIAGYMQ